MTTEEQSNYNKIKSFLGDTMLPSLDGYTKLPKIVSPDEKNSNKEQNTNGVLISTHSFPKIFKIFDNTCKCLNIPNELFNLRVYPELEIQGYAYTSIEEPFDISISSGSVNRLSEDELSFLIGHEIGHCLMGSLISFSKQSNTLEDLVYSRRLEVSADRFGYLAVGNIETATKTLMKLMTGLNDEYLDYDINKILESQNNQASKDRLYYKYLSHPPDFLRISFLYNYSLIGYEDLQHRKSKSIEKSNKTIEAQLDELIDNEVYKIIQEKLSALITWLLCLPILMKQQIKVSEVAKTLAVEINADEVKKTITLVSSIPDAERASYVYKCVMDLMVACFRTGPRLTDRALHSYKSLFPTIRFDDDSFYKNIFE
tara:strand:+ start:116 stop:1228 length:1113 start_codon:yes stop_codon:yes gene_type:complete